MGKLQSTIWVLVHSCTCISAGWDRTMYKCYFFEFSEWHIRQFKRIARAIIAIIIPSEAIMWKISRDNFTGLVENPLGSSNSRKQQQVPTGLAYSRGQWQKHYAVTAAFHSAIIMGKAYWNWKRQYSTEIALNLVQIECASRLSRWLRRSRHSGCPVHAHAEYRRLRGVESLLRTSYPRMYRSNASQSATRTRKAARRLQAATRHATSQLRTCRSQYINFEEYCLLNVIT